MFYLEKLYGFKPDIEAAGCLVVREGKILLLKRSKGGDYPNCWGFPSGRINPREIPYDAMIRELEEETGIKTDLLFFLGKSYLVFPELSFIYYLFRLDVEAEPEIKLSDEHVDFKFQEPSKIDFSETVMDSDKVFRHFYKK
jgi:8-oxo-dGTP pyrophosphatase MutT (NUDIX family)